MQTKWPTSGWGLSQRLGVFPFPPPPPLDGMLAHRRVNPSIKFAGTHLYTWAERGTMRVKCLGQENNTMSPLKLRPLAPESSAHFSCALSHSLCSINQPSKIRDLRGSVIIDPFYEFSYFWTLCLLGL